MNSKVVMVGYSTFEVKDKCGKPKGEEDIGYEYVNIKRYIYDFGRGKLLKIIEFHNGKLFEVSDGI